MSHAANLFDIKSANLDLLSILLRTTSLEQLTPAFSQRLRHTEPEAYILDIDALPESELEGLAQVCHLLRKHQVHLVGIRHKDPAFAAVAAKLGLPYLGGASRNTARAEEAVVSRHAEPAPQPQAPQNTMIIDRPVRAGQQIYARGADLVVLEMVSAGAELIADGSIHVYAPLRGRALAGARGNTSARIFVQSMEAELVSIAGVYRTIEQDLPDSIRHKPTQIYLEQERVVMVSLNK